MMPAYVNPTDRLTVEALQALSDREVDVYPSATERNAAVDNIPDQVLGTSPSITPRTTRNADNTVLRYRFPTDWTFTYQGVSWTVTSIGANEEHRIVAAAVARTDRLTVPAIPSGLDYAELRVWPTADPTAVQSLPLSVNVARDHWAWHAARYFVYLSDRPHTWQLVIPGIRRRPPVGKMAITIDNDRWWMWTGQQWGEMVSPPPRARLWNAGPPGVPGRALSWEQAPLAVDARTLYDGVERGLIAGNADWPFSAHLASDLPVEHSGHLVHLLKSGSRTVTVTHDCRIQALCVGRGGRGSAYRPYTGGDSNDSHDFGAAGGGAGAVVEGVIALKKGDRLGVSPGSVSVNGRTVIAAPAGDDGGDRTPGLGCTPGGNAGNRNQPGPDPAHEDAVSPLALPMAFPYRRLVNAGSDGRGRINGPSDVDVRGGTGGGAGGPNGLGYSIPSGWLGRAIVVSEGGNGGTENAAGAARVTPGSGGAGGGGGPPGTLPLTAPDITWGFNDLRRQLSFTISGGGGNEYRWRVAWHTGTAPPVGDITDWTDYTAWETGPVSWRLGVAVQFYEVTIQAQVRRGSQTRTQTVVALAEGTAPTNLGVVFNQLNAVRVEYTLTGFNVGVRTDGTQGFRHRWRRGTDPWSLWTPPDVSGNARFRQNRGPYTANVATEDTLTVEVQAANNAGTTAVESFVWNRPSTPPPGLDPPSTPAVLISYTTGSNTAVISWTASRAVEYRMRLSTIFRDGTTDPGAWTDWSSSTLRTFEVGATVAQITAEVEARNQAGTSSATASRSFSATTLQPPPVPSISFTGFTGGTLTAVWTNLRADASRWRTISTTDKGSSRTSAWSSWTASAAASITVAADIDRVELQVQVRNGASPNFNVEQGSGVWQRPQAVPADPEISVENVYAQTGRWRGTLVITSAGAERFHYRISDSEGNVLTDWTGYSTRNRYDLDLGAVDDDAFSLTIEAQTRNTFGESKETSFVWSSQGGVGPIRFNPFNLDPDPNNHRLTISWQAASATEYQYAIDRPANWTPWSASPLAEVPLAVNVSTVTLHVRARAGPGFAYRQASATWTRPAAPVTGPPDNLNISLRVVGATWTASWSAESVLPVSYSYEFGYTAAGVSYTLEAVDVGQSQIASGTVPLDATQVSVRMTATNARGSQSVFVDRQLSTSPNPRPGLQQAPPPPEPPPPSFVRYDPPPPATSEQGSSLQGTAGLTGLTLIRHSAYGQPFSPV